MTFNSLQELKDYWHEWFKTYTIPNIINRKDNTMPLDPQFDVELQALANKFQVHIVSKATPVNPSDEAFDITATAQAPTEQPAPAEQPAPEQPVA